MMDKVSIKAAAPKAANQATQSKPEAVRPKAEAVMPQPTEKWLVMMGSTILGYVSSKEEQAELVREWRENR